MTVKVCVIGAGVVGLTTATLFQEACPDAKVEIIADQFLADTLSTVAAGIFRTGKDFGGPNPITSKKWLTNSYNFYSRYLEDPNFAKSIGVKRLSGYIISRINDNMVKADTIKDIVDECRPCTAEELAKFPTNPKYGTYMTTLLVECLRYLPYLQRKFLSNGGTVKYRKIESFEELSSESYDLIFNCCGLGGKELCGDTKLTPIRGQVFKVSAPWLDYFLYDDSTTYILPGFDAVTIGGTKQIGDYDLSVNKHDSARIWENCTQSIPALKEAKIIKECVGLRPHRPIIRVEKEDHILSNGKPLKIVHNYGHGSYGVMSSPGTSIEAVQLGLEVLRTLENRSKL